MCIRDRLLAIALQEVHAHGSEIHEEVLPNEYYFRQSPLSAFMAAVTERYHSKVFAFIKRIEDGTSEPPEPGKPPVLYEYEQRSERRQIGFKTQPTQPENDNAALRYNATVITQEPTPGTMQPKQCAQCGVMFTPKVQWQKFCRTSCKEAHHTAKHGGRKFDPSLKKKHKA